MAHVKQKHANESFDSLLRRFKKAVDKDDVLKDFQKHEFYEKPCEKRKRAVAAAKKRSAKKQEIANPHTKRMY
jgi:small subunit ribosomal protein S21